MEEKYIEITLIRSKTTNASLDKIVNSINMYLLRNKGAVSDFNLIKDIADRNIDAVDEEIHSLLPVPLYLGLMGTMIGIVIGLFFMPGINDADFENAINILIDGVKIAMVASFTGLLCTVYLSGWEYKGARLFSETSKNDFFSWVQTQLLPVLSQNISSSIYSLQANLLKFNDTFSANIGNFNGVMVRILNTFDSQVHLMNELKEMDVAQLAKLNVNVLRELRESTREFEKFNFYLAQLNTFVDNAQKLNFNINNQLERTQNLELIAGAIGSGIETNKQLIGVLQADLKEISERKQLMADAVIDVDKALTTSLDELKRHIDGQINAIKEITIKEEDLLEKVLREDRGNLNELKKLSELKKGLTVIEQESQSQNNKLDRLYNAIEKLGDAMRHPVKPKENTPEIIRYATYIFIGTGAISGVGFCFWTIYQILF